MNEFLDILSSTLLEVAAFVVDWKPMNIYEIGNGKGKDLAAF